MCMLTSVDSVHVSQSSKGFKEYTASLSSALGVGQNHMGLSKHIDLALVALKADTGNLRVYASIQSVVLIHVFS